MKQPANQPEKPKTSAQSKDTIILASDHAAYDMKDVVKKELLKKGLEVVDVSEPAFNPADDYPVYAARVARAVSKGKYSRGITLCGTGLGASMTANRFPKVRAALCITPEMARLSREHNDSNVLVLGGRITSKKTLSQILSAWLDTPFAGGRHERRKRMIDEEGKKG